MKIFSFPYIVTNEIIRQFEPSGLINLSFCSKRAHAFVKMFAKNRKGDELQLSHQYPYGHLLSVSKNVVIRALSNKPSDFYTSALKTMHGLRWSVDEHRGLYTYCPDGAMGCRRTANYICDLLNVPVSTVHIHCASDLWMLDVAEQRKDQQLKNVYVYISDTAKSYSRVMRCNATQYLYCDSTPPRIYRFDGKLPPAKKLTIKTGFWITREQLLGLESQFVTLSLTRLQSSDINALLRSWLNGGLVNLKYIKLYGIEIFSDNFDSFRDRLERVQGRIGYKKSSPLLCTARGRSRWPSGQT